MEERRPAGRGLGELLQAPAAPGHTCLKLMAGETFYRSVQPQLSVRSRDQGHTHNTPQYTDTLSAFLLLSARG